MKCVFKSSYEIVSLLSWTMQLKNMLWTMFTHCPVSAMCLLKLEKEKQKNNSGVFVLAVSIIVGEDALKEDVKQGGYRQGPRKNRWGDWVGERWEGWQPSCFEFKRPASVVYYVCFWFLFFFLFVFCLIVNVWRIRAGAELYQKGAGQSDRVGPAETGEHSGAPGSGNSASSDHAGAGQRAEDTCIALTMHWP